MAQYVEIYDLSHKLRKCSAVQSTGLASDHLHLRIIKTISIILNVICAMQVKCLQYSISIETLQQLFILISLLLSSH